MKVILLARQTHAVDDYVTVLSKGFDLPFMPLPGMYFNEAASTVGVKAETVALGLDGVVRVEGTTEWATAVAALQNRDIFIEAALRNGWRANAPWAPEEIEPAAAELKSLPAQLKLEIAGSDYSSYILATRRAELPYIPAEGTWMRTAEGVDAVVTTLRWELDAQTLEVQLDTKADAEQWAGVVQDALRKHVEDAGWAIGIQRLFGAPVAGSSS